MAATTIRFIDEPLFEVDFRQFAKPARNPTEEKTESAAQEAIAFIQLFFSSAYKAASITFSYSWISFKHIVLGYYGNLANFRPPADIYLAIFKVAIWVFSMAWTFTATTARLCLIQNNEKYGDSQPLLDQFAHPAINTGHIQTQEVTVDMSAVPANVTIDLLANWYVADEREEGSAENLATFITHVNNRVAFLGTPPATDTPRLMKFYALIENITRYTIHKALKEEVDFKAKNGNGPYEGNTEREYLTIQDNKKTIAQRFARAGLHCGARYMSESLQQYNLCKPEAQSGTLQESLIQLLAESRLQLAIGEIATHFGNHRGEVDTHAYANYMASLGHILALPGTEEVVEHLARPLNPADHLPSFFQRYTVNHIIEAVREKVKSSQHFREQIVEWFKSHKPEGWRLAADLKSLDACERILREPGVYRGNIYEGALDQVITFVTPLEARPDPELPSEEYLIELFNSNAPPGFWPNDRIQRAKKKQTMIALFSEEQLGTPLLEAVKAKKFSGFTPRLLLLAKVDALCRETNLPKEIAIRVVNGTKNLREAITEHLERQQPGFFIERLIDTSTMHKTDLSNGLLEWILVSQGIFHPQLGEAQ